MTSWNQERQEAKATQVLDGLMMGDGCLVRQKGGAFYQMSQAKPSVSIEDHLKYEQWIAANVFEVLGITTSAKCPRAGVSVSRGRLYRYAHLRTLQSPLLTSLYDEWYTGGEWIQNKQGSWYIRGANKVLLSRLMKATTLPVLTLAHWFLGDGGSSWDYLGRKTPIVRVTFSVHCFTKAEVYHLMVALNSMGIVTVKPSKHPCRNGSGLVIHLAQRSVNYFMDLVEPSILEIFGDSEGASYKDAVKRKLKLARVPDPQVYHRQQLRVVEREEKAPGLTCKVCGHSWTPRTSSPKLCPKCKHRNWREGT